MLLKLGDGVGEEIGNIQRIISIFINNNLTKTNSQKKSDTIQGLISRSIELIKEFRSMAADCDKMKEEISRLKGQSSTVMYQPAVFHSENAIEDSGGEYYITFSLHAEDCFCDKHTFISFGAAGEHIKPGQVYMFGLTYEFSDAGYLYNFISDVRELTQEELDSGYADPGIY